jgi:hypothetical protein
MEMAAALRAVDARDNVRRFDQGLLGERTSDGITLCLQLSGAAELTAIRAAPFDRRHNDRIGMCITKRR